MKPTTFCKVKLKTQPFSYQGKRFIRISPKEAMDTRGNLVKFTASEMVKVEEVK